MYPEDTPTTFRNRIRKIVNLKEWWNFSMDYYKRQEEKNQREVLQKRRGVYALCKNDELNLGYEIVYIGMSINFLGRIRTHTNDKDFDFAICYDMPNLNQNEIVSIEVDLIKKYKPRYNKKGL